MIENFGTQSSIEINEKIPTVKLEQTGNIYQSIPEKRGPLEATPVISQVRPRLFLWKSSWRTEENHGPLMGESEPSEDCREGERDSGE